MTDRAIIERRFRRRLAGDSIEMEIERGGRRSTYHLELEHQPSALEMQRAWLIDRAAPPLRLFGTDGKPLELATLRGRPVVLVYWASWCAQCRKALPTFASWQEAGATIVMVTDEVRDAAARAVREHSLPYPLLIEDDHAVWRDYLMQGMPAAIVVDKTGIVRHVALDDLTSVAGALRALAAP